MDFESFKWGVINTFREFEMMHIRFLRDEEKGRYIALCNGLTIIGNATGLSVKIKWHRGQHQALAMLVNGKFVGK